MFTAVIVAWNSGEWLGRCHRSLQAGHSNAAFQVILVDNASSDGSPQRLARDFSAVELIINEQNGGFARACNQGIRRARGRYVLLLNPDVIVGEGALDAMVAFMDDHPEVGILGPRLLNPDGSRQHSCRLFPTYSAALFNRTSLLTRFFPRNRFSRRYLQSGRNPNQVEEVDWVSGACMLVRREAIKDVGLLDEAFFLHCEDVDWCKRMWAKGWKVVYFPKAEMTHRIGHSTSQAPFRTVIEQNKSIWRYYKKYFPRGPARDTVTFTGVAVRCGLVLGAQVFRAVSADLRRGQSGRQAGG